LYTFERSALEKVIKGCNDEYENVILFGHNEAITNFVNKFGTINIDNVSTSGVVFLTFQSASWRDISKGITERVVFPRDLK
jgi:phosphohistidine phosphatase